MALKLYDKMVPGGDYPLVDAKDVEMPGGGRLSEFNGGTSYPIVTEGTELKPETYYAFGEVDRLNLTLVEPDDGKAHEFYFEFIPGEDFTGLTITPAPAWVMEPQWVAGKLCQVSILRGVGVAACV